MILSILVSVNFVAVLELSIKKFGFFRDEKGIYHTLLDAWRKNFGYNPFYDLIFHYAVDDDDIKIY
jgi:hypothetical protein